MNKIAPAALLIAVSLSAQTGPVGQDAVPAESQVASQVQSQTPPSRTVHRESPANEEIVKKYRDLGYSFYSQPDKVAPVTPTPCAIPLVRLPVPDKERFAIKTVPANPSIDPKIVLAPPLPSCQSSVVPPVITPPKPAADKK